MGKYIQRFSDDDFKPSTNVVLEKTVDRLTDGPMAPQAIQSIREYMQDCMYYLLSGELSQLITRYPWSGYSLGGTPRHDIVSTQYDNQMMVLLESIHASHKAPESRVLPVEKQWISTALQGRLFYEMETKPADGGRSFVWGELSPDKEPLCVPNPAMHQTFEFAARSERVLLVSLVAQRRLIGNWLKSEARKQFLEDGVKDDILHAAMVLSKCSA